ncbi:MAG: shikimate dehydrogenase [Rhodospirillales bacterium]|nr:shikimate dehydrogenase [Rhodospirillales bacterium]
MRSGQARLAGIIGWPVAHSRSPLLHGTWLDRHGIDGAYVPLAVAPGDLAAAVDGLRKAGFAGLNVTIPHKVAVRALCDRVSDFARRAGAVNTLHFRDGRIEGSNTDGYGFLANLADHRVDPAAGPALVLGAGGAARAIVAALQEAGAPVSLANRTRAAAEALAADLAPVRVLDWEARHAALADHALVVNTTALGMAGKAALDLDLSRAAPGMAVADAVYVPLETPLLGAARAAGLRPVEGLGMLLHQAVPGFAAWFAVTPIVDAALRAVIEADLPAPERA